MKQVSFLANDEQLSFLEDALEAQLEEAKDILRAQVRDEPPLFETQTIGEAAEDYTNLVGSQRRRVAALTYFLGEVKK